MMSVVVVLCVLCVLFQQQSVPKAASEKKDLLDASLLLRAKTVE